MLRINKLKLGNPKLMHGQDQIQQPFFIFKKQNYESCFTLSKFLQKSGHVKTVFHTQLWVNQSYIFSVTWQIRVCSARKCVMDCKSFWQKKYYMTIPLYHDRLMKECNRWDDYQISDYQIFFYYGNNVIDQE